MNVLNMHISVRQGVDRINSNRADGLKSEEVDLELTRAQMRFINQRYGKHNVYSKGFEQSQKRIDELRTLLLEYSNAVTFKEELKNGEVWVDTFQLPADYMYLVNQRSTICKDRCRPMSFVLEPMPTVSYFTFTLQNLVVFNNTFVDRLLLIDPNLIPQTEVLVWEPSVQLLASGYTPAQYPQYTQAVLDDILTNHQPGFEVYYGSYGTLSFPGQLIVVVNTSLYYWFNYDLSQNQLTPLVGEQGVTEVTTTAPRVWDSGLFRRIPTSTDVEKTQVLNRFSQQDDIFRLLDDPFNTTFMDEPLTTIRASNIDLYTNAMFIVEGVKITYIRRPREISLSLGYSCELPDHTHEDIVAMAVSSILEEISDPRYQTNLGELLNRE